MPAPGVVGTITLTNGELGVSNTVTIFGPGPASLAINGNEVNPDSATFKAADEACKSLMQGPPDTAAGHGDPQAAFQEMLAYSQCMRDHGLKDFPDPKMDGGRITMGIQAGQTSDLDPNSATFKAAAQAFSSR